MPMNRAQKDAEIAAQRERFEKSETVVLAHNNGLTVAKFTGFRNEMRKEGGSVNVVKNTLAEQAAAGTKFAGLISLLSGPVVIASSPDPVTAAKVAHKFAKDNEKFVIIGGAMGSQIIDAKGVEQLAKLPSLDELRAKLLGLLQAPATKVAGVIQAPAGQLARLAGAYAAKG